jgi:hypothetical protein
LRCHFASGPPSGKCDTCRLTGETCTYSTDNDCCFPSCTGGVCWPPGS